MGSGFARADDPAAGRLPPWKSARLRGPHGLGVDRLAARDAVDDVESDLLGLAWMRNDRIRRMLGSQRADAAPSRSGQVWKRTSAALSGIVAFWAVGAVRRRHTDVSVENRPAPGAILPVRSPIRTSKFVSFRPMPWRIVKL